MKLCLGTVQFGMNYGIQNNGKPEEEKVFEILDYATEKGVSLLDTAAAYGEAERVIGDYFRACPGKKADVGVISKLRPDAFDDVDENRWGKVAVQNARDSLFRLGTDKIRAYLFHNASYIYKKKAVDALAETKKNGLTEQIGVSIYTPEEAIKALDYPDIGVIQIPYNVFDQRLDRCGFFEKAKAQGVKVFARSSLLQGLVMMDPMNLPARVSFARKYLEKFIQICDTYGLKPLGTAVSYVGEKPGIDYVVFGVDNIGHLKEYLVMSNGNVSEEARQAIKEAFSEVEEKLVNPVLWR